MLVLLTSPKFNCHQRAQLCKMSWIFDVSIHLCPGLSWGRVNSQNLGGGTTKNSWPEISKGTFRTIWRHAQYIDWGSCWGWRRGMAAWEWAEHWVQVVSNCITYFIYSLCYYYIFSPCAIPLNWPYLNPWVFTSFFSFSSPSHQGVGRSDQTAAASTLTGPNPWQLAMLPPYTKAITSILWGIFVALITTCCTLTGS